MLNHKCKGKTALNGYDLLVSISNDIWFYNLFILPSVIYIFIGNSMFELICVKNIPYAHCTLLFNKVYKSIPTGRCEWIYDIKFTSFVICF